MNMHNVVAVGEGTLDPDQYLGRITMCTIPDREVSGAKLLRSWAKHGLNVNDLPEARQPVHIFQTACSSVKRRRATSGTGERIQITADEVDDNGTCDYQIGVKVWDVANRLIEYQRDMRVTFNKQTSAITVDDFTNEPRLRAIEDAIRSHFDANAKTVPGQKVRNAVRKSLLDIGSQNMRRKAGGVYFVPATYKTTAANRVVDVETLPVLEGLRSVLEDLYGGDADFHIIPLANDEGERAMVRKHFVLNASEQAAQLNLKAVNRLRESSAAGGRTIRSDALTNMENERRELLFAVERFEKLVDVEQSELAQTLSELEESMRKLRESADDKGTK